MQVRIEILRETYDEIQALLREQDMEHEEGLRTVLINGLGYLDASLRLDKINRASRDDGSEEAELVQGLVQDLATYHSMYSVLKYKTFKLYRLAQKLEFNVAGLRAADQMWEEWAERMRREHAVMQAEVIRLRALMSEFKTDMDPVPSPLSVSQAHIETLMIDDVQGFDSRLGMPQDTSAPQLRISFWWRIRTLFRSR